MKKLFFSFAAMAVTFLMSADLHSSNNGAGNNSRESGKYCAYIDEYAICEKKTQGVACYLVDEKCNWIDDQQPED